MYPASLNHKNPEEKCTSQKITNIDMIIITFTNKQKVDYPILLAIEGAKCTSQHQSQELVLIGNL